MPEHPKQPKGKKSFDLIEVAARGSLGALAITALVLAATETHEAIGTALVGAAIAFGLGAAFFDRLLEVSTQGVKLADRRALEAAADEEAPEASQEEKEALVAEGSEILTVRRSTGEKITPDLALREASLGWQRNVLAVEMRFANWLLECGWTVRQGEQFVGAGLPDLVAEKDDRHIAVDVKGGRGPIGVDAVRQAIAHAAAVEAISPSRADRASVQAVLVLGEVQLTSEAMAAAASSELSVYLLTPDNQFRHLAGPPLD